MRRWTKEDFCEVVKTRLDIAEKTLLSRLTTHKNSKRNRNRLSSEKEEEENNNKEPTCSGVASSGGSHRLQHVLQTFCRRVDRLLGRGQIGMKILSAELLPHLEELTAKHRGQARPMESQKAILLLL